MMTENLPPADNAAAEPQRILRSEELLQGHKEIVIRHGEECYRLRLTRSGKLILQK